jgi:hypothetical protein
MWVLICIVAARWWCGCPLMGSGWLDGSGPEHAGGVANGDGGRRAGAEGGDRSYVWLGAT